MGREAWFRRAPWLLAVACVAAVPAVVAAVLFTGYDPARAEAALPLHRRDKDYVGASACRSCHPDHFASWRRTFHSTMTQLPGPTTVRGHFDGNPVTFFGATAIPSRDGARYVVDLPEMDGRPPRRAEVALVVGSRRLQAYFERVDGPEGATYWRLPIFWQIEEGRWMHLNGAFLEPDGDRWANHVSLWNRNCVFCHNTGIAPGMKHVLPGDVADSATASTSAPGGVRRVDSHVADLGIACEACHGPGRAHVDHNTRALGMLARYRTHLGEGVEDDIVDPMRLPADRRAALCGQCHSQRVPNQPEQLWRFLDTGPTFRPGDRLEDHVSPIRRDTIAPDPVHPDAFRGRFWSDGTARLTGYEYLGLTQSPCTKGGQFSCDSCHTMHGGDIHGQLVPEMRGDRACTQCHAAIGADVAAHTHHPVASAGSRCLECHMPRIVYGLMTIHRSHRVEIPDVARDVEGGRPNACTLCHADRTAAWAAGKMAALWGPRYRAPTYRPDSGPLDVPEGLVSLHAGDPIQRAAAEWSLGRRDSAVPPAARGFMLANALVGLGDGYASLRLLARRTALALDGDLGLGLTPALTAFDTLAPSARRDRDMLGLLRQLERAAGAKLPPPPVDALVAPSYHLRVPAVQALIALQRQNDISIGE